MMTTIGEYNGNLKIILRLDKDDKFVLDVYNQSYARIRLFTVISKDNIPKDFMKAAAEDWIDALLDSVCSGVYCKYWFLPFLTKPLPTLDGMVRLVKEKYKLTNMWR